MNRSNSSSSDGVRAVNGLYSSHVLSASSTRTNPVSPLSASVFSRQSFAVTDELTRSEPDMSMLDGLHSQPRRSSFEQVRRSSEEQRRSVSSEEPSSHRLHDLLTYLDDIERESAPQSATADRTTFSATPIYSGGGGGTTSSSSRPVSTSSKRSATVNSIGIGERVEELNGKLLKYQLELKDRKETIELLQKAVKKERAKRKEAVKQCEKEFGAKLQQQKVQYESTLQRHQELVDKLLVDKESLTDRVAKLTEEIAGLDKVMQQRLDKQVEQFQQDLKRNKDSWAAAEKVRRDNWMQEKTKEIKERTIKGLEPEIQRMLQKHQQQMAEQQNEYEEKIRRIRSEAEDDKNREQHRFAMQKEQLVADAVEEERQRTLKQLREQTDSYETRLHNQRLRLASELDRAREEVETAAKREKEKLQDEIKFLKSNYEHEVLDLNAKYEVEVESLRQQVKNAEKECRAKWEQEQLDWQRSTVEQLNMEYLQKEKTMKERFRQQQQDEIDMIVRKLEGENAVRDRDMDRKIESKFVAERNRLKETITKLEAEVLSHKKQHAEALKVKLAREEDAQQAKRQMVEMEIKLQDLERNMLEQAKRLKTQDVSSQLHQSEVAAVKQKYSSHISDLEEQIGQQQHQLSRVMEENERTLLQLKNTHAQELERLHARIKSAVQKKDEMIGQLNEQIRYLTIQVEHAEEQLQKKRYEMFSSP